MPMAEYTNKQNPICSRHEPTCAAYSKGRCKILHDTKFTRPCPFYKTWSQVRRERGGDTNE